MFSLWRPSVVKSKNTPRQTAVHANTSDNINQTGVFPTLTELPVSAVHTWLLYESECVVFCLHHHPVANRVVFLEECLNVQLEE